MLYTHTHVNTRVNMFMYTHLYIETHIITWIVCSDYNEPLSSLYVHIYVYIYVYTYIETCIFTCIVCSDDDEPFSFFFLSMYWKTTPSGDNTIFVESLKYTPTCIIIYMLPFEYIIHDGIHIQNICKHIYWHIYINILMHMYIHRHPYADPVFNICIHIYM
jgi:hypothetical protein